MVSMQPVHEYICSSIHTPKSMYAPRAVCTANRAIRASTMHDSSANDAATTVYQAAAHLIVYSACLHVVQAHARASPSRRRSVRPTRADHGAHASVRGDVTPRPEETCA